MVRHYKRKKNSNYRKASPEEIEFGLKLVRNGLSVRKAAEKSNVPPSTLQRNVNGE